MQSISQLQTTPTTPTKIISLQTMETAADILAQAPAISMLQIGEPETNDYYFEPSTQGYEVTVMQGVDAIQTETRDPTLEKSLCEVTIIPC